MVGTTTRSDGKKQVTYNGHPLYTFIGDSSPGDTSGQGVNAFGGQLVRRVARQAAGDRHGLRRLGRRLPD